jgi:hypothetical protein
MRLQAAIVIRAVVAIDTLSKNQSGGLDLSLK